MDQFDLKKMIREIAEDGRTVSRKDPRLSPAGVKKLVAEKRNAKKNEPSK